jgi:hypothetical protein
MIEVAIPPMLRASWDQAEAELYQVVMTEPVLYQRAVVLVGRLAAVLTDECADPAALVLRASQEQAGGWPTVLQVAAEAGVPLAGIDPGRAGRAGCAMAGRRLVAAAALAYRRDRLAAARQAGADWVLLEESGDPAGVVWSPYRRLEVRTGSGLGVLVSTEPDEDLTGVLHRVLPVRVDPESGELAVRTEDGEPGPAWPYAVDREAQVARIREALDRAADG